MVALLVMRDHVLSLGGARIPILQMTNLPPAKCAGHPDEKEIES